jgi:hypothetical protein
VQSFFGIVQLGHEDYFSSEEEEELDGFGSNKLRDFVDSRRSVFFESDEQQSGEEDSAEEQDEELDEKEKEGTGSSHDKIEQQLTDKTALLNAGILPILHQLRSEVSESLAELGAGKWMAGLAKSTKACRLLVPCARQELEPYVGAVCLYCEIEFACTVK